MKDEDVNIAIGRRLRAVRSGARVTQGALAEHLGVTFQQIQKYENGTNRLSIAVMLRICARLGVDPGEFVNGISRPSDDEIPLETERLAAEFTRIPDETVKRRLSLLVTAMANATKPK